MNCADFERLIALDLEGDLAEPKGRAVAEHLKVCGRCREFAEKLKLSQTMLKSLAQEPVDEAVLEEVRQGVLRRLPTETEQQRFPVWGYALGAGLASIAVLAAITLRHPSQNRVREVTPANPNLTAGEVVGHDPVPPQHSSVGVSKGKPVLRRREHFKGLLTASVKPLPRQQLTVKLVTDDPNVVIYWLVD